MTIDELEESLKRQQQEERRLVNKNSGYPQNGRNHGREV